MRIYHEDTSHYLQTLATSLKKDPASFEHWRCLHLESAEPIDCSPDFMASLKEEFCDIDADVIFCDGGVIFVISQEMNAGSLRDLARYLLDARPCNRMEIYDLFYDWRHMHSLLTFRGLAKTGHPIAPAVTPDISPLFADIASLQEVFSSICLMRTARQPLHVLIVDDDVLARRIASNVLKDRYAVVTAADAHEAVSSYLLHAPDVVFLDIDLPDFNGFEVLRQLLAVDPHAYIVMFSGNDYLDNVNTALASGAAGFVAKPFRREKLWHYVQGAAKHHRKVAL